MLPLLFSPGLVHGAVTATTSSAPPATSTSASQHYKVLILGGGVAGVIAARTLHQNGIDDFLLVDALDELGGRMMSYTFANKTIEQGPNWIQGTQTGSGPANPIFELANKYKLTSQLNDWSDVSTYYLQVHPDIIKLFITPLLQLPTIVLAKRTTWMSLTSLETTTLITLY